MSLRLVQYYFESKERLLFHGLQHLTDRFTARVGALVHDGRGAMRCA